MEEELQKLFEQYSSAGYNQNRAWRELAGAGYDTPEARMYMKSLYDGTPKKKSQDTPLSDSSSEEVSMESTSATVQPQGQEAGGSDSPPTRFDEALDAIFPGGLNVPDSEFQGPPNRYNEGATGAYRINPKTLINDEEDNDLDRMLLAMQASEFEKFAMASAQPVQALASNAEETFKAFLPKGLLSQVIRPGETTANRYGEVLNNLALAYVLDERTRKSVDEGKDLELALLQNEEWMRKMVEFSEEDFSRRRNPYDLGMKGALFNRELRKVINEVNEKRDELETDFVNNYFGRTFIDSLPSEYNETFDLEDGTSQLTERAKSKLGRLEKQLKRRTGYGIDLSGDNKVGNRPMIRVSHRPGNNLISLEGELIDILDTETTTVLNGLAYVTSQAGFGLASIFTPEGYLQDYENEFRDYLAGSEERVEVKRRQMNEYQRGNASSIANEDYSGAIEQSFLMTAGAAPYLVPMLASSRLGITGTAAASTFLGVSVEANTIKDDKTFDIFVKDGKEYTYYEAAEEVGSYDMEEIEKKFAVKRDFWSRTGYLSAVAVGDFGVNYALNKQLLPAYKKGMELELKNWFRGFAHGQRTALGETAAAMAGSQFLRNVAKAEASGGTVDFNQVAQDTIDQILGTAPLTMLLHTAGSARRALKGTAQAVEIIPMNAEELGALRKQVLEYQRKIANSKDPRFISEANQFILNSRKRLNEFRQLNEDYLSFLSEKNPEQFLEVTNAAITLERLKMNYRNTNDPNLKIQYKENASALLTRMDEIYGQNKGEFDKFQGSVRGVREREEQRKEEGRTREQDQAVLDEQTSPQQRTDDAVVEKDPGTPTLSPYSKRNDRVADIRGRMQGVKNFFNRVFRSSGGVGNKNVEEVVRSRERLESAWIDELDFDARLFRQLLKDVRRSGPGRKLGKNEMRITQESMLDFLQGRIKADDPLLANLTPEHKTQLGEFRRKIDGLSESLITAIESQPAGSPEAIKARQELVEKIRRNKGAYLTQSYELFNDGGKRLNNLLKNREDMPSDIKRAYDEAVEFIANRYDNDITADVPMTKEERLRKADQELGIYLQGLKKSRDNQSFGFLGAMDAPFLKAKNNDLPEPIANLLGKIKDPMNAYLTTASKLESYLSNARWQNEMAMVLKESGIGRVGSEFEGMSSPLGRMERLFPNSPEWMPLHQQYVPAEFKKAFDNLMPLKSVDEGWYRTFIGVAGKVKLYKTVFAPTTTARNLVSGTFLGMANGHLPAMMNLQSTYDAMTMAWGASAKRGSKGKGKYSDSTWRAERRKLIEMGILNDGANSSELMQFMNDSMGGDVQRIIKGGGKQGVKDFAQKLYAFGDDFYKVNGYYQERKAFIDSGMPVAEAEAKAAARVRGGYPTYSYISKGAKELRRFPFAGSFVSFPYEMYRTTLNNFRFMAEDFQAGRTTMAMKRAMGLLTSGTTAFAISEYSMDRLGLTDEDDEAIRSLGPEWQKLAQLVYLGTEDGSPYFMDASYALPHETIAKPIRALFGGDPNDEGYVDNVMTAAKEVMSPFISQDVSFKFVSALASNRTESGAPIIQLRPDEEGISGLVSACIGDEERNKRNLMRALAHSIKSVAPGYVGNITEFIRAGAVEESFALVMGEDLPNGHPLEELQDDFQDIFPEKTKYKEYTLEDAFLGLVGARMSYMPIDVAASNAAKDWKEYSDQEASIQWRAVLAQPEITMGEEMDERASAYIASYNYSSDKIQGVVNLAVTLGLDKPGILKMLQEANVGKDEVGYYIENVSPFPPFVTEEKIINYVQNKNINNLPEEELALWYTTAFQNIGEFNRVIANAYTDQLKMKGLSESQIEKLLNEKRNELGRTNWSEED